MELNKALEIANRLVELLTPFCEKINIAGSCRRGKSEVKDIEIVALPKVIILKDMFGWDEGIVREPMFEKTINGFGKVVKGNADGKMMQIELPEGITLDLFIPDDFDYYRQFAIRTGPADYSFKVIASGWRKLGWCGSDKGLRKMSDCVEIKSPEGKSKWKCVSENAECPPNWEDEKSFFEWINVKWVEPSLRSV